MKKTAFVCFGDEGRGNVLFYHELPRKESGEELFVFFSPAAGAHEAVVRNCYREAISVSRLGHPTHYFVKFIEAVRSYGSGVDLDELLPTGSIVMIMMRRSDVVYLLVNRASEAACWNGETGTMQAVSSLSGFTELVVGDRHGQGDLFDSTLERRFALYRFTVPAGERTFALLPSREFLERHRERLLSSIFFPAFEVPETEGVEVETARTFPAIHWGAPAREGAPAARRPKPSIRRISIPAAAGILTALIAIFLIFGPPGNNREPMQTADAPVLLTAEDDERSTERVGEPVAVAEEASPESALSLEESWKRAFDAPVTSSPVYRDGAVYFGCRDGALYAFGAGGEQRWKYDSGRGMGATPCCLPERVIGANYAGDVFCLDRETGARIWAENIGVKIVSSPGVNGNIVLIGTMDGRLAAFGLEDGSIVWTQKIGRAIWGTSVIGDDYIMTTTTDGSLIKLNHEGKVRWRVKPGGEILSSPLVIESRDLIVFGSKDKFIYAYKLSNGDLMWRYVTGGEVNSPAEAKGEAIFMGSEDGFLYKLTLDGRLIWRKQLGDAILSRPLVFEAYVFVTTYGSKLMALDREGGEIMGKYQAGSPIYSSPEHGGERIFFGSNGGTFYALTLYKKAD